MFLVGIDEDPVNFAVEIEPFKSKLPQFEINDTQFNEEVLRLFFNETEIKNMSSDENEAMDQLSYSVEGVASHDESTSESLGLEKLRTILFEEIKNQKEIYELKMKEISGLEISKKVDVNSLGTQTEQPDLLLLLSDEQKMTKSLEDSNSKLKIKLSTITQENEKLKAQMNSEKDEMKKSYEEKLSKLEEKLTKQNQSEIEEIQMKFQIQIDGLKNNDELKKSRLSSSQTEADKIKALNIVIDDQNLVIANLDDRIAELENQLASTGSSHEETKRKISESMSSSKSFELKTIQLEHKLIEKQKEIENFNKFLVKKDEELTNAQETITSLNNTLNSTKADLQRVMNEIQHFETKEEKSQINDNSENLKESLKSLQKEYEELKMSFETVSELNNMLKEAEMFNTTELTKSFKKNEEFEEMKSKIANQFAGVSQLLEKERETNIKLKNDIEKLQKEKSWLNSELDSLKLLPTTMLELKDQSDGYKKSYDENLQAFKKLEDICILFVDTFIDISNFAQDSKLSKIFQEIKSQKDFMKIDQKLIIQLLEVLNKKKNLVRDGLW
jgi:chromosome segregation ATPase